MLADNPLVPCVLMKAIKNERRDMLEKEDIIKKKIEKLL